MIYLFIFWLHRIFVAGRGPSLAAVSRGSSLAGMLGVSPRRLPLLPEHRLLAAWLQWMRLLGSRRRALFVARGLYFWHTGLGAPWQVASFRTRDGTDDVY
ncbi:unnamed protein product [Rangifer tarandus platyrhynchus]|uniref:Secreted protein n=1 Tax=Rangifer tarandus platyrhynchus TaxID=3082113 RepID=A0ABN8YJ78_RANTA|nr:unnamed protein product [Rangifer tarandus platyrhynchus]